MPCDLSPQQQRPARIDSLSWATPIACYRAPHRIAQGSETPVCSEKSHRTLSFPSLFFFFSEKVVVSQERVSGLPDKGADLRGSLGNFRGSFGNFRGTSGLLVGSTVRELPGKSPKNFQGSSGNFRGSPGTSQKLGAAWLPPSDSPNLSPIFGGKRQGKPPKKQGLLITAEPRKIMGKKGKTIKI